MDTASPLRLYDFYLISYFPIFIAVVLELFISFIGLDETIDGIVSYTFFSVHWLIRIVVFLIVAYSVTYRLHGSGIDGFKAGIFCGAALGILYSLFFFIWYSSLGNFFDFLALPWQTMVAGGVITSAAVFFLSLWKAERSKIIH